MKAKNGKMEQQRAEVTYPQMAAGEIIQYDTAIVRGAGTQRLVIHMVVGVGTRIQICKVLPSASLQAVKLFFRDYVLPEFRRRRIEIRAVRTDNRLVRKNRSSLTNASLWHELGLTVIAPTMKSPPWSTLVERGIRRAARDYVRNNNLSFTRSENRNTSS